MPLTLSRNFFAGSKTLEDILWPLLVFAFPLIFWAPGYDSFHEPKWLLLTAWVGLLVVLRIRDGQPVLADIAPLALPLLVCLGVTFFSLRWMAADHWVALAMWLRLPLIFLVIHLLVSWIRSKPVSERVGLVRLLLSMAVGGGCMVALLAIFQDWGYWRWGDEPVSDWRFHLSSTLGNPNEVGGYLCYLLPVVLARWFSVPTHRPRQLLCWGLVGLLLLYGLTTVFTVGAWLGLFLILPLTTALIPAQRGISRRRVILAVLTAGLVFGLLRVCLSESLRLASHTAVMMGVMALLVVVIFLATRWLLPGVRWRVTLALVGLFLVWGTLLPPHGIPNHPDGLVSEALASPRWKGGFGARRFIWTTTALMIKDHPLAGIGWGHYFTLHNLYQGELYRQRGHPHDRSSVGLVPQVHSDPLQVIAEAGVLGGIAFFWLVGVVIRLWVLRLQATRGQPEPVLADRWACGAGLLLIFFHSLVDFPFRQPQPVLLAMVYLSVLAADPSSQGASVRLVPGVRRRWVAVLSILLGLLLVVISAVGLRDQRLLKQGYEDLMRGMTTSRPGLREVLLQAAGKQLDSILYPLPDTHDRWLYRAQVALQEKDLPVAEQALLKAGEYRHTLALYETWLEYGKQSENPVISLGAIQGLLLYNPCWAGYYDEEMRLLGILGRSDEAKQASQNAKRFRVPEKPGP